MLQTRAVAAGKFRYLTPAAWILLALLLGLFALIHSAAARADYERLRADQRRYEVFRSVNAAAHGFLRRSIRSIEVREYGGTPLIRIDDDVFGRRYSLPAVALKDDFDGWQI